MDKAALWKSATQIEKNFWYNLAEPDTGVERNAKVLNTLTDWLQTFNIFGVVK